MTDNLLSARSQNMWISCFSELDVRSIDVRLSTRVSHRFLLNANTTMGSSSRRSRLRMSSTHIFLSRPALGPNELPRPPVTFWVPPRPPTRPPRPCWAPPRPPRPASAVCFAACAFAGVAVVVLLPSSFFLCASDAALYPVGKNASCSPTL